MILFPYHTNSPTTNTIQNIFINLRAIKVRVITSNFKPFFFKKQKKGKMAHQGTSRIFSPFGGRSSGGGRPVICP